MSKIQKSNWFKLIHKFLKTAKKIEQSFIYLTESGYTAKNILIYCQSGSGPSAVLSSLAQVLIDPYYRTFEGFQSLILKEWVYFGHNFMKSLNLNNKALNLAEQTFSPMFVLFLDCVYQLLQMNRTEFEFTEEMLVYMAYHAFSCKYYELTHLNPLEYLVGTSTPKGVSTTPAEAPDLVSLFNFLEKEKYLSKMYQ